MKFVKSISVLLALSATSAYADSEIAGIPTVGFVITAMVITGVVTGALIYLLMCNKSGACDQTEFVEALKKVISDHDLATTINVSSSDPKLTGVVNELLEFASNQVTKEMIEKSTAESKVLELEGQMEELNETLAACYAQQQDSSAVVTSFDNSELLLLSQKLSTNRQFRSFPSISVLKEICSLSRLSSDSSDNSGSTWSGWPVPFSTRSLP